MTIEVRLNLIVTCISNISTTKYMMCVMKIIRKKFYFRIPVNGSGILTLTFSFWGTVFLAEKQSLRGSQTSLQKLPWGLPAGRQTMLAPPMNIAGHLSQCPQINSGKPHRGFGRDLMGERGVILHPLPNLFPLQKRKEARFLKATGLDLFCKDPTT